ncbi:hypothetical protein FPQ18DRAFT_410425 [Pyronema domesticum]|nr:hypothetical protein FPQ18DRAFT_410425 [Pyronema domesticum]
MCPNFSTESSKVETCYTTGCSVSSTPYYRPKPHRTREDSLFECILWDLNNAILQDLRSERHTLALTDKNIQHHYHPSHASDQAAGYSNVGQKLAMSVAGQLAHVECQPELYSPMYPRNAWTFPAAGYNSSTFGPGQQYAEGYAPNAYHPHMAAGYAFTPSLLAISSPALEHALDPVLFSAAQVPCPPSSVSPVSELSVAAHNQAVPPISSALDATGTVATAAPAKRKRNDKTNTTGATTIPAGPKQKGKRVKTPAAALSTTQLAVSSTEPEGQNSIIIPSEETPQWSFNLCSPGPLGRWRFNIH